MSTSGHTSPDGTDFVGPTGNATEKYAARNPVTQVLLRRFLAGVDAAVLGLRPETILDVGCGEGIVTRRLGQMSGAPIVGVDLDTVALSASWRRQAGDGVSFLPASAYELPFEDRSFDCVCALEVLEHLERPREALGELARVARRALLLSVPREPLWRAVHLLAGRDVRELGNTPGHINHWSSRAFADFVSEYATVTRVRRPFPWTVVVAKPVRVTSGSSRKVAETT